MALTPTLNASTGGGIVAVNSLAADINVSLSGASVVLNFPTPEIQAALVGTIVATNFIAPGIQISQTGAMVVAAGRISSPRLRAWTFTLDGHDFYVLRLGDAVTLVYDVYSEQWVEWSSSGLTFWRPNTGMNWIGGQIFADSYGSDIVVGDDVFGLIYFLDPDLPYDEAPSEDAETQERYFERIVMGQVVMRGREVLPCYATWLTTDMGDPAYSGAGVTLFTSDDAGETFDDMGTVNITMGEYSPEISWYSLGQIAAPGRLFKIVDDGAVARIDGMEMNDPDDAR